uniref:CTP synthase n=1 Tax=Odontella aurita TaxID=265563 RepID=A0A7S4IZ31_9STRA|mmetsp:Transcript_33721/g.100547  ORF Transcript_33721/g.100547 Transcript_33721/m.100547 type:complete len:749 (+) Transcript_33721:136-2382(+)
MLNHTRRRPLVALLLALLVASSALPDGVVSVSRPNANANDALRASGTSRRLDASAAAAASTAAEPPFGRGRGGRCADVLLRELRGGHSSMPPALSDLVSETVSSDRKIVVVTGGVLSGIGKGVTASSIGVLFRAMGLRVTALKIDPYLNVDAGTMSPFEHGEVFVLDDGGETDLDLGNYERFLGVCLTGESNLSTGKIYREVIERERIGEYLGKTVQVVPHVSDAIQEWVLRVARTPVTRVSTLSGETSGAAGTAGSSGSGEEEGKDNLPPEVCIVELGGTLGDIESMPFVEALRQLQEHVGYKNMCFVHVSLVPVLGSPTEQKTKPTQHSVKSMMQLGLRPDFICCRGKEPLEPGTKSKLSLFTSVPENAIISIHDVTNIYRVPLMMLEQRMSSMLARRLRIRPFAQRRDSEKYSAVTPGDGAATATTQQQPPQPPTACSNVRESDLIKNWTELADGVDRPEGECRIAMVGKYCDQGDAYLSVVKALTHSAIATKQRLRIEWIVASDLTAGDDDDSSSSKSSDPDPDAAASRKRDAWRRLRECDGVVVPGGFGRRGFDGKIRAVRYARESRTPFLGICLGMQAAVVEYARNVLGRERADSAEFEENLAKDEEDCVVFMPEGDRERMGGTMRLGARETVLKEGSLARRAYGDVERVMERHRHRYEVNPNMVHDFEEAGLHFVGRNSDGTGERMEVIELDSPDVHPYFVAAQFHPEFTSRPERPNPLFYGLLQASKDRVGAGGGDGGVM